ncbi:hypothetical protein [Tautonia plasticadhaerens]|uniref:Uncharacterized protein n=1 Tax=Tautonia plasticadhaerens TaxID=2527974 RepID=A0A518H224_9BACT|nr:hypothetical protein [Tautonia plasticadhaerens]QDV34888.1 hypothetical protein ElP_27850 [Tautonia plasticadhaerens]
MTGKPWWTSATMVAGLTGIIIGAVQIYAAATGAEIDIEALRGTVENGLQLILGIGSAAVGVVAMWGRVKAVLPIKKQIVPKLVGKPSPMVITPGQEGDFPWHQNHNQGDSK